MGLLRDNNIREKDIDRIEVQLERPSSMGGVSNNEILSRM